MNRFDPGDLLADSAPTLSDAAKARHLAMLNAVMADPQSDPAGAGDGVIPIQRDGHRSRRRTLAGAGVAAAALLAVGAGAAVAWVDRAEPTVTDIARCFATSDPAAAGEWTKEAGAFFDTTFITGVGDDATTSQTAAHAVAACAANWRAGGITATPPYLHQLDPWYTDFKGPKPPAHPVPELAACVLPNGWVGVFPDTTCAALRLPQADI